MKNILLTLSDGDMITPLRDMTISIQWKDDCSVPFDVIKKKAMELVDDWKGLKTNPETVERFYGDDEV